MENVQRLSRKRVHQKRMLMETGKSSNMKLKFTKEELEKLSKQNVNKIYIDDKI